MKLTEKQKNCPYCHESDLLYSTASPADAMMSSPWRLVWPDFLNDNSSADSEEIVHGQPSGTSMMAWHEGVMEHTVMLYHPEFNPNTKKWTMEPDCMTPPQLPDVWPSLRR